MSHCRRNPPLGYYDNRSGVKVLETLPPLHHLCVYVCACVCARVCVRAGGVCVNYKDII